MDIIIEQIHHQYILTCMCRVTALPSALLQQDLSGFDLLDRCITEPHGGIRLGNLRVGARQTGIHRFGGFCFEV